MLGWIVVRTKMSCSVLDAMVNKHLFIYFIDFDNDVHAIWEYFMMHQILLLTTNQPFIYIGFHIIEHPRRPWRFRLILDVICVQPNHISIWFNCWILQNGNINFWDFSPTKDEYSYQIIQFSFCLLCCTIFW